MGIMDNIKDALSDNKDKVCDIADKGIDKAGDMIDEKTGGKFAGQVDQGQDMAKTKVDEMIGMNEECGKPSCCKNSAQKTETEECCEGSA